jgi:hypothetical protein
MHVHEDQDKQKICFVREDEELFFLLHKLRVAILVKDLSNIY